MTGGKFVEMRRMRAIDARLGRPVVEGLLSKASLCPAWFRAWPASSSCVPASPMDDAMDGVGLGGVVRFILRTRLESCTRSAMRRLRQSWVAGWSAFSAK